MESAAATRRHDGGDGAALKHFGADQHTTHVSEQAMHGMNDFHQVKSAMSKSSRETMKHYDGTAGAPTITDDHASEKSKKSQGGELKPAETNDAMVRDPYAAAQQRAHYEHMPMDERGNHAGDNATPNNPLHASSQMENGHVKSATLADGGGSTTYNFDAKGKPASVTNSRENGTFVTNYGPDGHVTAKTFTDSMSGFYFEATRNPKLLAVNEKTSETWPALHSKKL